MTKGKLIVIDALDGAGKETQTKLLSEHLYNIGVDYKLISFPNYESKSAYGIVELLRGNGVGDMNEKSVSVLYTYDRLLTMYDPNGYECGKSLIDFYNEGGIIIADRYTSSNSLYQTIDMSIEEKLEYLYWLHDLEFNKLKLPEPDLILFLDVAPDISIENIKKRQKGFDNYENIDKLTKVYNTYKDLISEDIQYPLTVVKCTDDNKMKSIEEINKNIINILEEKIL